LAIFLFTVYALRMKKR